jgi:transcriptional regulator with XRE-family HTH domain
MASRLEAELRRELRKQRRSAADVAREAGVEQAWFRQVMTSRIVRPDPDGLRAVANVLGLSGDRLLALTDQLGAPAPTAPVERGSAGLVDAINAQTEMLERVFTRLGDLLIAARGQSEAEHQALADAMGRLLTSLPPEQAGLGTGPRDHAMSGQ